jgi:hypothetical protein
MLYAFDLLELDGEDLRTLPLSDRKKRLAGCPPNGTGRHSIEAAERALSIGPFAGLDQGEEPAQVGDDLGARGRLVKKPCR